MTKKEGNGQSVPPYVSYRTFRSFLDSALQIGLPARIDRSVMRNLSGANQTQVLAALRYLGLINEDGTPTKTLDTLASVPQEERAQHWRSIVESAYRFVFDEGLDLSKATPQLVEERFRATGAQGDTVRKCISFFLAAARDADIPISSHLAPMGRPRSPASRSVRARVQPHRRQAPEEGETAKADTPSEPSAPGGSGIIGEPGMVSPWPTMGRLVEKALDKLPQFDPNWDNTAKERWLYALDQIMDWAQRLTAAESQRKGKAEEPRS